MKKILFLSIISFFILSPCIAQEEQTVFKAKVIEILQERELTEGDVSVTQQELKLRGLEGKQNNQEFVVNTIEDILVVDQPVYNVGDKVYVYENDIDEIPVYYIVDFVRTGSLFWLTIAFIALVLCIGKKQGLRALIVLALTFIVILQFMIPRLMQGDSPIMISVIGGIVILGLAIFGTEGFNKKSKVAFIAVFLSLLIVLLFSILFTQFAHLTGYNEHVLFLVSIFPGINLQGLLLAGIIIGSLGVLDDIVISQISLVKEFAQTDVELSRSQVYKIAMRVGTDHINAIVNTLFLAYAGAALPLLMLFSVDQEPFLSFSQVINNEIIATEIVRTLVGSMCLILAMPLATWLATNAFVSKNIKGRPDFDVKKESQLHHHHH